MDTSLNEPVRLTQFSHGAGCGCKIAPAELEKILATQIGIPPHPQLVVGLGTKDDAAVYDLGDGRAIISTTDFFTPIVDDPVDFGRIAATNALSDVYAMGGKPLLAVAVLGWPVGKLGSDVAAQVVEGGRMACQEAGIPLAGGHSIDAPEPFFGLAVTGEVALKHLKRNDTARNGDVLLLTKPLGVGVLSTAQKRGQLQPGHAHVARDLMAKANVIGMELGKMDGVHALTDVTGFGLLGHLGELCRGSQVKAGIRYSEVPVIPEAMPYVRQGCYPDGTMRNWKSVAHEVDGVSAMEPLIILCDPQTSGGLLIACDKALVDQIAGLGSKFGHQIKEIGHLHNSETGKLICVE